MAESGAAKGRKVKRQLQPQLPLQDELDYRLSCTLDRLAIFQGELGEAGSEVTFFLARSSCHQSVAVLRLARGEADEALQALREALQAAELSISHVQGLGERLFQNSYRAFAIALMLGDAGKADEYARVICGLRGQVAHDDLYNSVEQSYLRAAYEALADLWLGQPPQWSYVRPCLDRLLARKRSHQLWLMPGLPEALEAVAAGATQAAVVALGQMLDEHHRQMATYNSYLDSASEALICPLALLLVAVAGRRGLELKPLLAERSQRRVLLRPLDGRHRPEVPAGAKAAIDVDYLPELFLRAWRPAAQDRPEDANRGTEQTESPTTSGVGSSVSR
ncbi:hypothetical protein [Paucibacter sp. XJ19-41]|uniref:hypothetical protein n=1 Tax=Paucibacter sp. XJ19-41 TaxID=2927824 RepID=UPI00234B097C|nr:hypothetical protein [Paucibacter sp. XJ19-41]